MISSKIVLSGFKNIEKLRTKQISDLNCWFNWTIEHITQKRLIAFAKKNDQIFNEDNDMIMLILMVLQFFGVAFYTTC